MNTIGKITFDFNMENEQFARSLYARWDTFFAINFERIVDRLLMKYDVNDTVVQINKLDIDLGCLNEDNFDEYFPLILEEKLEEALLQFLHNPQNVGISSMKEKDYLFGVLCRFLLHGVLPWDISNEYRDVNHLFLTILQSEGQRLKAFLQTYGHYTSLQERLVYQLNDPELEKGVRLLAPGESTFICSYIHLLRLKYRALEHPAVRESDYRNVTWLVVYAYLLTNRSSYFNKKSFIVITIEQLAARFNLPYDYLLRIIVSELDVWATKQAMPSGLFLILDQLRKELSEKNLKESVTDIEKLYRLILSELSGEGENAFSEDSRDVLLITLANSETCRKFLQLMKEDEIVRLVTVVEPDNSGFIVEYAQSLDRQQEYGALQGKAGSEFRLLKWQIIFPVLLENTGVSFNRKYFVHSVLSQVAAHYNIEILDILKYICFHPDKLIISTTLNAIFHDLLDKYSDEESLNDLSSSSDSVISLINNIVKNRESVNVIETENLILQLSVSGVRSKIVDMLSEEEHHYLVSLIVPSESHFIIPYAIILDKQQNNNILEGKASGNFSRIKWEFIYAVLVVSRNQVFNKKSFVDRTLNKIAAHHNVTVQDLLDYFYKEKVLENITLPFNLVSIFDELKINYAPNSPDKKEKEMKEITAYSKLLESEKILEQCFGNDASYKKLLTDLAKRYDFVLFIRKALLSIRTLHHYLESELNVYVNKEQIVSYLISISGRNSSISLKDIIGQVINILTKQLDKKQQIEFIEKIESLDKTDDLLGGQSEIINYKNDIMEKNDLIDVNNAGIVLFTPFLLRLFSMLSLTDMRDFKNKDAKMKAIFLLHYAVWEKEEARESDLVLNKLFLGLENSEPVPQKMELSVEEKEAVTSMLNGVLQNWEKLKRTSLMALRDAFLRRNAKLEEKEDAFHLTVEEKAYDLLMDSIPWNFKMVRLPWMKKHLIVKWR